MCACGEDGSCLAKALSRMDPDEEDDPGAGESGAPVITHAVAPEKKT